VTDPPLELFTTDAAFRPNPTTVRFARTVRIDEGAVVFDMGTGIGPLSIKAAMDGAREVHGVDPVALHCELARMNVAKYNLQDRVFIHQGLFFDPFDEDPRLSALAADVIIGDVSGIAEPVARALGWYSDEVPTGGYDGTEVIIDLLSRAAKRLAPDGKIYFPIAIDLSDSERVLDAARSFFQRVDNAMERPTTQFPFTDDEVRAIDAAYSGHPPKYIQVQPGRRPHWRGQIWVASTSR
jgi:hypothetical protein